MYFHFSTVVWGPWHTGVFLDVNLPSLLAEGNLPAFVKQHRVKYRIFTSAADHRTIAAHPALKKAAEFVEFEFVECPVETTNDPIGVHHMLWRRSIAEAAQDGAMILFVPPDVAWSNGSFRHVADLASAGKKAIFMTYMRVVSESCAPELRARHLSSDGITIQVASRDLVDMAMQYIHPLTLTYLRESQNFPIHPEFILWRVPGEGYLMRVLVREMFAYEPGAIALNGQALPAHALDPDDVHFINDSDDLFALSFAPLMKDTEWFTQLRRLDPIQIGSWWLRYDSPANDLVSSHHYYIHRGDRTPEAWRRAELTSDIVIDRIIGAREALRTFRMMNDPRLNQARQLLAAAIVETRLSRMIHHSDPLTLIVPANAAILRWLLEQDDGYDLGRQADAFVERMLDHIIIGPVDLNDRADRTLTTARGRRRRLRWLYGSPLIDDVPLQRDSVLFGSDWSHILHRHVIIADDILPRCDEAGGALDGGPLASHP